MNGKKLVLLFALLLGAALENGPAFYNASTGRWLSRDPITERGGRNLYAFVRNEPVSQTDKLGKEVNSPPVSVTMTLPCKPRCGREIPISAFRNLQQNLARSFYQMDDERRKVACGPWKHPQTRPLTAVTGWDIGQLFNWADFCTSANCGVPASKCANTVWVSGACHYTYEVNYVVFGWLCNLCAIDEKQMDDEVLVYRNVKELLPNYWTEDMSAGAKAWADAGYFGWPSNESLAPNPSSFSQRFKECEQCGEKVNGPLSSSWPGSVSGRRR